MGPGGKRCETTGKRTLYFPFSRRVKGGGGHWDNRVLSGGVLSLHLRCAEGNAIVQNRIFPLPVTSGSGAALRRWRALQRICRYAQSDYAVHKSEGAIFLWLLLPQLSITTRQMYHELKKRGVIVVPGEYFFFGNATDGSLPKVEDHPHYTKCLRINYSRPENEVEEGIKIIAEVYRQFRTE